VVKVVAPLLPLLPSRFRYKVIFMERDIHEVLGSQRTMLDRAGKKSKAKTFPLGLHNAFLEQLKKAVRWQERSSNVDLLRVPYSEALSEPRMQMERVSTFLGGSLDVDAMAAAVDPSLHRQKPATTDASNGIQRTETVGS
jgi:hypothetical protein